MRVNYSEIFPPFSALLYFGTVERPQREIWHVSWKNLVETLFNNKLNKSLNLKKLNQQIYFFNSLEISKIKTNSLISLKTYFQIVHKFENNL